MSKVLERELNSWTLDKQEFLSEEEYKKEKMKLTVSHKGHKGLKTFVLFAKKIRFQ